MHSYTLLKFSNKNVSKSCFELAFTSTLPLIIVPALPSRRLWWRQWAIQFKFSFRYLFSRCMGDIQVEEQGGREHLIVRQNLLYLGGCCAQWKLRWSSATTTSTLAIDDRHGDRHDRFDLFLNVVCLFLILSFETVICFPYQFHFCVNMIHVNITAWLLVMTLSQCQVVRVGRVDQSILIRIAKPFKKLSKYI